VGVPANGGLTRTVVRVFEMTSSRLATWRGVQVLVRAHDDDHRRVIDA
jgi:hypothetical protein